MVRSKSSPRKKKCGLIQDKLSRFLDLHIVKLPAKINIKDEGFVFCTRVKRLKKKNLRECLVHALKNMYFIV